MIETETHVARDHAGAPPAPARTRPAPRGGAASPATLRDLIAAAGTDVPRLAPALGLGRAPVVDLVQGRVATPVPVALLAVLADALGVTVAAVEAAVRTAGAGADPAPSTPRRAFVDILRDDPSTPPDRRAGWLAALEG